MPFKKLVVLFTSSFLFFPALTVASTMPPTLPTFSSAEHIMMGDNIIIRNSPDDAPGQTSALLRLPNELTLTYGTILALGDFYGIPDQPISAGSSESEKKARFLTAFNAFAAANADTSELKKIVEVMQAEKKLVEDGLKNGEQEDAIYQKVGDDFDRQYNCITGGSCVPHVWWAYAGRYLLLAKNDYDHFNEEALAAYQAGHAIALEIAVIAYQTHDVKKLQLAYALNAFASHFLSDRFATGHMRTPRKDLPSHVTPNVIGDVLVHYMHNEENVYSLHVHNLRGDHWIAYGSKEFYRLLWKFKKSCGPW